MVKHSRKKIRRSRRKTHRKYSKSMFGGQFNSSEINELQTLGFNGEDIQYLSLVAPNLRLIKQSLQQINPDTGNLFTPEEIMESVRIANEDVENHQNDISYISYNTDDEAEMNTPTSTNSSLHFDSDNSQLMEPLNDSDLNVSNISSQNTSIADENSIGGKKRRTVKRHKNKRSYKKYSYKKNKKGGVCFGRGIGANDYDPNIDIYNSNMLTLFPYRA
jgi:hypothetical protein